MKKNIILALGGLALAVLLFAVGCGLEINDPVRSIPIVRPYISVQPKSTAYDLTDMNYEGVAALSIQVYDWRSEDGTLSYQWYAFTDMEDYLENGATAMLGATDTSYTPVIEDEGAGLSYFFYVVVTNDYADALEGTPTRATIQSDVAIISFYDDTMAPMPVITRHPVDASYTIGRAAAVAPLEVRAVVAGEGTLSYQWYSNSTKSIEGGTELTGQTDSSYLPDILTLPVGAHYFYVEITNTVRISNTVSWEAKVFCVPVAVTMVGGDKVSKPRITVQPRDQFIITSGTVLPLTVEATSNDGGAITYQWYSANKAADEKNSPVTGTAIGEPSDDGEFTPVINTASPGTNYYYAMVTNTNENVSGNKVETVRSKVVTVKVAASDTKSANATIKIENTSLPANRFQYIRGYGGMEVAWANFPETYPDDTHMMYNPDWGLGYNILRIMIVPPGSDQRNYTNHTDIVYGRDPTRDDYDGWKGLIPNHRPSYIKNVQIVNDYGGYVLASPWTPPKEWKTNNSINSGGHLIPAYYKNFGNYLRAFCQFMYLENAPVYAVSIANEPNYAGGYDGCEWSDRQMMEFFLEVGQFTQGARGYGGGKSIPRVLIVNGESANHPNINNEVLNNPVSRAAVDFYARHVYGDQLSTLWANSYADWREGSAYQTECWMTEHNINSANAIAFFNDSTWDYIWKFMNDIDLVIRMNNENAFVWWASKRFYSFIGDDQSGTVDGVALPRGYGMSHYAKYTIDTTRVNFTMSGTLRDGTSFLPINRPESQGGKVNVTQAGTFKMDSLDAKITAYESQDGSEISMVMYTPTLNDYNAFYNDSRRNISGHDLGIIKIELPGDFTIGSVKAQKSYRTYDSLGNDELHLMEPYEVTVSSGRDSVYVELNRSEILSVKFTRQ